MIDDDQRADEVSAEQPHIAAPADDLSRARWRNLPANEEEQMSSSEHRNVARTIIREPGPVIDSTPVDVAEPVVQSPLEQPDQAERRRNLALAASFGVAAIVILVFSALTIRPADPEPLIAEVQGTVEEPAPPVENEVVATDAPSSSAVQVQDEATTSESTAPARALVDVDVVPGQLEVSTYSQGLPVERGEFSFAVRLFNVGETEITMDHIVAEYETGNEVASSTLISQQTSIAPGQSAVGLIRANITTVDTPITVRLYVGDVQVGGAVVQ